MIAGFAMFEVVVQPCNLYSCLFDSKSEFLCLLFLPFFLLSFFLDYWYILQALCHIFLNLSELHY